MLNGKSFKKKKKSQKNFIHHGKLSSATKRISREVIEQADFSK